MWRKNLHLAGWLKSTLNIEVLNYHLKTLPNEGAAKYNVALL